MSRSSSKVVICGAGIAGVAAAYYLAVECGLDHVTLVDEGNPLSLTSDKSTEAYRNWWPGPDWAMTAFMNRSIDLIEGIARATDNRINLNRRGYVFATADAGKIPFLETWRNRPRRAAAARRGFTTRPRAPTCRRPSAVSTIALTGADVITDASSDPQALSFLAPETVALAHARRAGWLSAQQLGMVMLEAARARGVQIVKGRVVGIDTPAVGFARFTWNSEGDRQSLAATHVVLAAGPMQRDGAHDRRRLPIRAERHFKVSFPDTLGALPRNAPMLIWLDEQHLPWSDEERAALAADEDAQLAPGHVSRGRAWAARWRHRQRSFSSIIHGDAVDPVFPLPEPAIMPRSRSAACRPWCRRSRPTRKAPRPLHRRRLLHEDAGEPAADRTGAGRGRLHFLRVLRLWRDGVVRGRRAHRSPHHRGGFARLRAGLPAVTLPGCRLQRIARTMGRWRPALSVRAWRDEARRRLTVPVTSRRNDAASARYPDHVP